MKGIYKKISVGVLAAALLVGAGGIAQGRQAFADSQQRELSFADFNYDYPSYSDYSLINKIKRDYDHRYDIISVEARQKGQVVEGELDDSIDFMFFLKRGNVKDKKGKSLDLRNVNGQEKVYKIGKYFYRLRFK